METIELTDAEIADEAHRLYDGLAAVVARTLKTSDNVGVRLQPYAKGALGRTHLSIGIEGLLTGPNATFLRELEALAPGADYDNPTGPDGRALGWRVHLPVPRQREVTRRGRRLIPIGRGGGYRQQQQQLSMATPVTGEWVALLWMLTGAVGGLLYYRMGAGILY